MDLLDSILRVADAREYVETFRNENIDAYTLKLLSAKDLELLGIEDKKAQQILEHAKKFMLQAEARTDITCNSEYAEIVLSHIYKQLLQHEASFICAAMEDDIVNCDIQLEKGVHTLLDAIEHFRGDLQLLNDKMQNKRTKKYIWRKKVLLLSTTTLGIMLCGSFILFKNFFR